MKCDIPQLLCYHLAANVTAFSTTRHGGCGKGGYASFNINRYCGDDETDINRNRDALCLRLGISGSRLIMPHQTHGDRVACIDNEFLTWNDCRRQAELEGIDAVITSVPEVCIGVSTADCIPILLYDSVHHAAGAVHAGWRGTVQRIVGKAIEAMTQRYGSQPSILMAQIGPGISIDSFEVGKEVYDTFACAGFRMDNISRRYATEASPQGWKWHIDLPGCNRRQLIDAGLRPEAIHMSDICTYKHPETFFSARRLGIKSGRIFTGIKLETNKG